MTHRNTRLPKIIVIHRHIVISKNSGSNFYFRHPEGRSRLMGRLNNL